MKNTGAVLCMSLAVCVAPARTANQGATAADRTVAEGRRGDASLALPLQTNAEVEGAVLTVAASARVPTGIERVKDNPLPARVYRVQKQRHQQQLTGLRVRDAMKLISDSLPSDLSIQWDGSGEVLHVSGLRRETFLDARIMSFDANGESLRLLLARIHRLVDPEFPSDKDIGSGGSMSTRSSAELTTELEGVERPLRISATNCTIRELLDRIVTVHGSVSWVVRYADEAGSHAGSTLLFSTFDGTTIQLGARRER